MSNLRIIPARNIREGDFYMEGFVNGRPYGESFTVSKVRKSTLRNTLSIHNGDDDVVGTTLGNDQLVIIERN